MVAWLSDWLRDVIAVLLLAVFVELLLPNKSMQRYARLVVGLFILLTILSPIIKLLQSDLGMKLDAATELWNERAIQREVQMPSLLDIQKQAERLSEKRNQEAAKLTERTLEEAMLKEIVHRTKSPVRSVDVVLAWGEQAEAGMMASISQVTVTLKKMTAQDESEEDLVSIREAEPVSIQIEVEVNEINTASTPLPKGEEEQALLTEHQTAYEIRNIIMQGWGVASDHIRIRQS